jgi:hypothetical protein
MLEVIDFFLEWKGSGARGAQGVGDLRASMERLICCAKK